MTPETGREADAEEPDTSVTVPEAERRRRRAQVFGDVLPDVTGDERDVGETRGDAAGDDWLRRQVPPHHG